MIQIQCKETLYTYNLYHITKAFFPNAEIKQCVDAEQEPLVRIELDDGSCFLLDAKEFEENQKKEDAQEKKKIVTKMVYRFLSEKTGQEMAWGMLTGVRPTKLAMHQMENGMNEAQAKAFLQEVYCVSEKKAGLAVDIACREKALLSKLDYLNGFSLYVGIPFCPSICSYCSFSSSPIDVWSPRMDDYLKALCIELHHIAKETEGKTLNTIYIGGGTPTTLTAKQLEKLLNVVDELFLNEERGAELLEYTVEAGRPDSITKEKLEVICRHSVTRISVNPQTMQQKTLDLVGRKHTVQAVKDIFHLARELGFDNINMDLIAGLPGENAEDMRDTLRQIEELSPDSLTVHSLAIKRAARMAQEQPVRDLHTEITEMVEDAAKTAEKLGLVPYYLYRQKNIAGNFENVGYAKADKAGIYNILIMEEKQTIYAAGAGATTKIVLPEKIKTENGKETNLIRIENVKNIEAYIDRIDEMIKRKSN
ncbi:MULTISPECIES: coproporphyrinogen dehydrogenase HemZ [Clostridia]|uniref:coproporphyrinogen dehydrogenase HemZ n=1 Tax=Clostridia TaxID=186801 RepID=UPI000EAC18CC|nr:MULTISPECIES: coproporphyrinogen dehydrogenase HemZ [Clostridia]RKQ26865.1 coproporphyrinogen dehydrogenase HemZ [Ruminococcus sp. B05]TAP32100.1 coproporphyrinogen dehydrogenase HemZ [Mediterraneibacter sp. gm002]